MKAIKLLLGEKVEIIKGKFKGKQEILTDMKINDEGKKVATVGTLENIEVKDIRIVPTKKFKKMIPKELK